MNRENLFAKLLRSMKITEMKGNVELSTNILTLGLPSPSTVNLYIQLSLTMNM